LNGLCLTFLYPFAEILKKGLMAAAYFFEEFRHKGRLLKKDDE